MRTLSPTDHLDVPLRSQYRSRNWRSSCLRLVWLCCFQISRCSKWIPRYLTFVLARISSLLMLIGWEAVLLVVNIMYIDLLRLRLILHCSIQSPRIFGCKLSVAMSALYKWTVWPCRRQIAIVGVVCHRNVCSKYQVEYRSQQTSLWNTTFHRVAVGKDIFVLDGEI